MNNSLNYQFNFQTNAEKVTASINKLDAATINVSKAAIKIDNTFTSSFNAINSNIKKINLTNTLQQINMVADGFKSLAQPGLELGSSLADLSAITGVTGSKLKEIEGYARESAKTFGGSAADNVEAYKVVLSKLNPEIAKTPEALQSMGNQIQILSKTMGGDAIAAADVLTTAMNQYQVSTADPIQASKEMATMMNVMAAGAKEGSAELPQIKNALEEVGMVAKTTGVSFVATNAAIQVLDKAGKKGAEGGVALRNVLTTLSEGRFASKDAIIGLKQMGISTEKLADASIPLTDRLRMLQPVIQDSALMTKVFGRENMAASIALIQSADQQDALAKKITGTNTAQEQAAIVMKSVAEENKRLQAKVDNFKISLFNVTGGWLGYADVVGNVVRDITNMVPLFQGIGTVFSTLTSKTKLQALWMDILAAKTTLVTGAQWLWNAALTANPIGLIIVAIAALIAIITTAIYYYDKFGAGILLLMGPIGWMVNLIMSIKDHWDSITAAFSSGGIIGGLKRIGIVLLDVLLKPVQQLLELLAKIPGLGGLAGSGAASIKALRMKLDLVTPGEIAEAVKKPKKTVTENTGILPPTLLGKPVNELSKSKTTGKTNEAIATGGTKHNYITINLKELIGIKANTVMGGKEMVTKAGNEVADELLRILGMATTATG